MATASKKSAHQNEDTEARRGRVEVDSSAIRVAGSGHGKLGNHGSSDGLFGGGHFSHGAKERSELFKQAQADQMKMYWITEEQIKAIEENAPQEAADEAIMFDDTMTDVKRQHIIDVQGNGDGTFSGKLLSRDTTTTHP